MHTRTCLARVATVTHPFIGVWRPGVGRAGEGTGVVDGVLGNAPAGGILALKVVQAVFWILECELLRKGVNIEGSAILRPFINVSCSEVPEASSRFVSWISIS